MTEIERMRQERLDCLWLCTYFMLQEIAWLEEKMAEWEAWCTTNQGYVISACARTKKEAMRLVEEEWTRQGLDPKPIMVRVKGPKMITGSAGTDNV